MTNNRLNVELKHGMTNENLSVLCKDGEYILHSVDVTEEKRTVYWISEMNSNVKVGVGKIIDVEAKTDDEAREIAKTIIEELRRQNKSASDLYP